MKRSTPLRRYRRLRSVCPTTGKRRFPTAEAAQQILDTAKFWRDHGDERRHEQRVYACKTCEGFHLSSLPEPPKPRKPLRPRSAKKAKVYRQQRVPLVEAQLLAEPFCQIRWDEHCAGIADTVHEIKKRSRGGSITDRANCVSACAYCNGKVEDEPAEAHRRGFAAHSWEKPA